MPQCKKYINQEPPYLMRQICVLQWEAIKTKNSGAKHQLWGGGGEIKYIAIVGTNTDYKMKDYLLLESICALKIGEGNKINKSKNNSPWESMQRGIIDIFQCVTGLHSAHIIVSLMYKDAWCMIHNGTFKKILGNAHWILVIKK